MIQIALECYHYVRSCVNCSELVQPGETVYLYTVPDRFTDESWLGFIEATVVSAYRECDACYNYVFEYDEADLPAGIAQLAACDVASVGCEPCAGDLITEDLVVGARLEADSEDPNCINLIVTKQKFQFAATKIGDPFETQSQHCNIHPYPYTSDPATW